MDRIGDGEYQIFRMLPPRQVEYYYSLVDIPMASKENENFT
jgi:hypothetical protein